MAFRPKDQIDTLLIQKYASERADNPDVVSLINPNEVLGAMRDLAEMQRNFLTLNAKLKSLCHTVNSKAASYRASDLTPANAEM